MKIMQDGHDDYVSLEDYQKLEAEFERIKTKAADTISNYETAQMEIKHLEEKIKYLESSVGDYTSQV